MSHPRFEAMLFEREELDAQERMALEQHLKACEACCRIASSWAEVEARLRKAPIVAPAAGFTFRFEQLLAQRRRRRRSWLVTGIALSVSLVLVVAAVFFGGSLLSLVSPGVRYLLKSLSSLVIFGGLLQVFTDFVLLIVERLAARVSPGAWLNASAAFSLLAYIWFSTMVKLNFRTSVQEVRQ